MRRPSRNTAINQMRLECTHRMKNEHWRDIKSEASRGRDPNEGRLLIIYPPLGSLNSCLGRWGVSGLECGELLTEGGVGAEIVPSVPVAGNFWVT